MSFYRKYELVKLIDNGEIKTFRASEIATGRAVNLHLLTGLEQGKRTAWLEGLRAEGSPKILEVDESAEAPYVVTEVVEPAPAPPPPPPPAPVPEAGEFTRMFLSPVKPEAARPVPPPPPAAGEPGEFTRLFLAPEIPPPRPVAAPAARHEGPGEFTRFFQSPVEANPIPVEEIERGSIAGPEPAPRALPFRGPSDFTVRFGPAKAAEAVPAPPVQSPQFGASDASQLFGVPKAARPPALPATEPQGPSDFTLMLKPAAQPAVVETPKSPAPMPAPVAPPKRGIPMLVIILIGVLVFGCLIVAIYFLLKR